MTKDETASFELTDIPAAASLIGGAALSLSLAWELGVFYQIDINILALLSINDVIANALHYVPQTLFFAGVGQYMAMTEFSPFKGRVSKFLNSSSTSRLDLIVFSSCLLLAFLFDPFWPLAAILQLFIYSFGFMTWARRKSTPRNDWIIREVTYALLILSVAFLNGATTALSGLKTTAFNYEITEKSGATIRAHLLISGERYLIVRVDAESVRAIAQQDVKEIRRLDIGVPQARIRPAAIAKWLTSWF